MVEAFARLVEGGCHSELRLAGSITEPGYGQLLKQRIKRYGLNEKVIMLGRISTEQIKAELASASIFALVSLEENSPMGIEESMAAHIPVVTSNRCGILSCRRISAAAGPARVWPN